MKTTCSVIQDLLPLYCDDACSAESRRLVEEHLKECDDCRETYQLMQAARPASAAHTQQQATAQAAQAWKKQGSTSFFKGCLVVLASVILLFLGHRPTALVYHRAAGMSPSGEECGSLFRGTGQGAELFL